MEKNETKWQEQEAPRKNHDDAFVQVGSDGEPVIPTEQTGESRNEEKDECTTTLDKR